MEFRRNDRGEESGSVLRDRRRRRCRSSTGKISRLANSLRTNRARKGEHRSLVRAGRRFCKSKKRGQRRIRRHLAKNHADLDRAAKNRGRAGDESRKRGEEEFYRRCFEREQG